MTLLQKYYSCTTAVLQQSTGLQYLQVTTGPVQVTTVTASHYEFHGKAPLFADVPWFLHKLGTTSSDLHTLCMHMILLSPLTSVAWIPHFMTDRWMQHIFSENMPPLWQCKINDDERLTRNKRTNVILSSENPSQRSSATIGMNISSSTWMTTAHPLNRGVQTCPTRPSTRTPTQPQLNPNSIPIWTKLGFMFEHPFLSCYFDLNSYLNFTTIY